jgi:hypothetical protein
MKTGIPFLATRLGGFLYYTGCILIAVIIGILAKLSHLNKTVWWLSLIVAILAMLGGMIVLVVVRQARSKAFTLPGALPLRLRREAIGLMLFALGLWATVCLVFPF